MIVTIDGPAGAGKSTAARKLAQRLGLAHLDTGATYRAATLKALREEADLEDEQALAEVARRARIELTGPPGRMRVLLDGEDVTDEIRTQRVTGAAHHLANSPAVREVLVDLQRRIGRRLGRFVTEGRDQGSVVFPEADVKFFLDADPAERARRRHAELLERGQPADYDDVLQEIVQRDERDRRRRVGPLVKPADAIVLDNSRMGPDQTAEALEKLVRARVC